MEILKSRKLKRIMTRIVAILMCIILAFNSDFVGVAFAEDTTETTEEKEYTKDENGFTCWEDPEMRKYAYLVYSSTDWGLDMNLNFVVGGGVSLTSLDGGLDNVGENGAYTWNDYRFGMEMYITAEINKLENQDIGLKLKYSPKHYEKFIQLYVYNCLFYDSSGLIDKGFINKVGEGASTKFELGDVAIEKNGTLRGSSNLKYDFETIYDVIIQGVLEPSYSYGGADCRRMVIRILRKIENYETYILMNDAGDGGYSETIDIYDTSGASLYVMMVSLYYPEFYDYTKQYPISTWWDINDNSTFEETILNDFLNEKDNTKMPYANLCDFQDATPFLNNLEWFKQEYSAIKIDTEGATVQGY